MKTKDWWLLGLTLYAIWFHVELNLERDHLWTAWQRRWSEEASSWQVTLARRMDALDVQQRQVSAQMAKTAGCLSHEHPPGTEGPRLRACLAAP